MEQDNPHKHGFLRHAFDRVAGPSLGKLSYVVTHYPSKATAVTGLAGDLMFFFQSASGNNLMGMYGAFVGTLASLHLLRYGDPKIAPGQEQFVDPQDKRSIADWVNHPTQYPWEYVGLMRMVAMTSMLAGGLGVGGSGMSYGEIGYSSFALGGYLIKMGIAEKEKGSSVIPENSKGLGRMYYRLKAFMQENPNPCAGALWNAGLIPYTAEAVLKGEYFKLGSAALYALPNTFTMFSSKRAQVMDDAAAQPKSPTPPSPTAL